MATDQSHLSDNAKIPVLGKGIFWSAVERFSVQGVQFVLGLVIARLVSPSDYGLIAILSIFLSIAQQFVDSGFSNALIQKQDRSEVDYSTVFYTNLILSLIVYWILYFVAPWIATFFNEPQLKIITRWSGINIILMGLSLVQRTQFTIQLNFKIQAKISLLAAFLSGLIGIMLAWNGAGVWALVVQSLLNNLLISILLWVCSRWRVHYIFSWDSFHSLFAFGSKLLIVGILNTFYTNLYTLIIGKKYLAADVGYFNRAQTLAIFPSKNISSIILRAIYPEQCRLQGDNDLLKRSFATHLRWATYIIFPFMTILAILSTPLIVIILTEKWILVAELLSILSVAFLLDPIRSLNWLILNVKGRSDLSMKVEIISKIVSFLILIIALPFGIKALCYSLVVSGITDILIMIYYVKKVLDIGYLFQFKTLFPIIFLSLCMALVMYITIHFFSCVWWQLIVGVASGILTFGILSNVLKIKEFVLLKTLIKNK